MRSAVVVDTNVPVVANRKADHAGPECVLKCTERLEAVRNTEIILLDEPGLIMTEYTLHLSRSGQPGVGDIFMKWVWNNQANLKYCRRIPITPLDTGSNFEEFPEDPELRGFDPDDRKFVAVALASDLEPPVVNAVDTDWWDYREPLHRNGVRVEFICPELMPARR